MDPDLGYRPQQYWDVEEPPDPEAARTGAEFAGELDALLRWSGLSPWETEQRMRAYGYVPEGTVYNLLHSNVLLGEEQLVPLLWALGCDEETVEHWVWARRRLATAHSVHTRHTVNGGRHGMRRHAVPDQNEARHSLRRSRAKGSSSRGRRGRSMRALIGLVVAGAISLAAGIAFAIGSGNDGTTVPTAEIPNPQCCAGTDPSASPSPMEPTATAFATVFPIPPPPGPTTRPPATTAGPPATTQNPQGTTAPPPQLTGSGGASCAPVEGRWVVDLSVTATLTGATSGTDPQGFAGPGEASNPMAVSGSGGTSFGGQATFDVGPDTSPVQGTIVWNITVTVSGAGTVATNGGEGFNCA